MIGNALKLIEFLYIQDKDKLYEVKEYKNKYENIIKYLLSECIIANYSSGKKYLDYDSYNNHLSEYLKKIEPELYEKELKREELDNKEDDDK